MKRTSWILLLLLTLPGWSRAQLPGDADDRAPKLRVISTRIEPATARAGEVVTLKATVEVEKGWHVYGAKDAVKKQRTELQITAGGEAAGERRMPDGKDHPAFGVANWWVEGRFEISRPVRLPTGASPGKQELKGEIAYVPCDPNICLPRERVPLAASVAIEAGAARAGKTAATPTSSATSGGDDPLPSGNLWQLITLAFFAGLLALVMPCTYPMIPITISFFTKQAADRGGFVLPLSLTYGFGIISIFILIGLVVGSPIVAFATHPLTNLVIGLLFLVFALSLFGAYELRPPAFLMNLAGQASARGGYGGVFLMGATLVVTSFTCTAPFVGTLLSVGAQTGRKLDLALGMGVFGLTMAVPFVVLSLMPGRLQSMPKSGEWLHATKVSLGFLEIAAALKFFSNADLVWNWGLLSRELFLLLWAGIFGAGAAYLFGWIKLSGEQHESIGPLRMSTGLFVLLFAIYCSYGAIGHPLDRIMLAIAPNYGKTVETQHTIIKDDWDAAVARARKEGKKLLVNFTGFT